MPTCPTGHGHPSRAPLDFWRLDTQKQLTSSPIFRERYSLTIRLLGLASEVAQELRNLFADFFEERGSQDHTISDTVGIDGKFSPEVRDGPSIRERIVKADRQFAPTFQSATRSAYLISARIVGGSPRLSLAGRITTPAPSSCRVSVDIHSREIQRVPLQMTR